MTKAELERCREIREKDNALRLFLEGHVLAEPADARAWLSYLTSIKDTLGNVSNSLGFVAKLLAKEYLAARFALRDFDAAGKPEGASGPDIEASTLDGTTISGEIKTTRPYQPGFGAQQKAMVKRDLEKLSASSADHRFMFVTDPESFRALCKPYYAPYAQGLEIIDLLTGETYCH